MSRHPTQCATMEARNIQDIKRRLAYLGLDSRMWDDISISTYAKQPRQPTILCRPDQSVIVKIPTGAQSTIAVATISPYGDGFGYIGLNVHINVVCTSIATFANPISKSDPTSIHRYVGKYLAAYNIVGRYRGVSGDTIPATLTMFVDMIGCNICGRHAMIPNNSDPNAVCCATRHRVCSDCYPNHGGERWRCQWCYQRLQPIVNCEMKSSPSGRVNIDDAALSTLPTYSTPTTCDTAPIISPVRSGDVGHIYAEDVDDEIDDYLQYFDDVYSVSPTTTRPHTPNATEYITPTKNIDLDRSSYAGMCENKRQIAFEEDRT